MIFQILFSVLFLLPTQSDTVVKWLVPTVHDFGDIPAGKPVTVDFHFKNTGAEPMTIDNVRTNCTCTASDWNGTVIPPGAESTVQIEYDAKKPGYFRKKITVYFSTQKKSEKLYVEGYVE